MVDLKWEEGEERKDEEVEDISPLLTYPSHRIENYIMD